MDKRMGLLFGIVISALVLVLSVASAQQEPIVTEAGGGVEVACNEQIFVSPLDSSSVFVTCSDADGEPPEPAETATPGIASTPTTEPAVTNTPVATSESPDDPIGDVGAFPDCNASAIPLEVHTWWHEDGAAERDINHMHLGTCYPNARPDGSVEVSGTIDMPVRVLLYNYPTTVDWVRYQWQGDTQQRKDIDFSCGGNYQECEHWEVLNVDTGEQNTGVDELRISPNIGDNPFGARHFITLNFQSDNGNSGNYRNSEEPIARSWYTGGSYLRVQWSNYMDLFDSTGQSVPTVSGNVEIDVRHSGDGCDDSAGYVNPHFHAFHAGNAPEPQPFYAVSGCFDGGQTLDTTELANGMNVIYLQSCGERGNGSLCTAMAYRLNVQN